MASSVRLSAHHYSVVGDPTIHELSVPGSSSLGSPIKTEIAVKLRSVMRSWFLDFVDDALDVDSEWKYKNKKQTLESLDKIKDWMERQIVEEEDWTKNKVKRLKRRIGDELRRTQEYWRPDVRPRNGVSLVNCACASETM